MSYRNLFLATFICLSFGACRPSPQFQQHYNVPGQSWSSTFQPTFQFAIDDTAAAYQLFLIMRHTDAYSYNNIWLTMETKNPNDTVYQKMRVEVPLAEASGRWLGRGMGEIWEQRVAINPVNHPAFFGKKGTYTIRFTQSMRRDPLPEVLQVGLRLEKLGTPHK